ncbi:MAG: substrate-binding domain-containing protein [Deltaproteobacteria bacterium]|nr:substrate-binding domain-containing protein [Deltaproteobacteria bacterium]
MKKWISWGLFCLLLFLPAFGDAQTSKFILWGSTIGPIDSGIVGLLGNEFEKESDIRVRHVGAGTGAALEIARKGSVDIVLAHAKALEEKFIQEGYGTERIPFMYNDFVIVGPASDPAGIKGMKKATEAMKKLSESGFPFITRGDKSGTHVAEMELWQKAGVKPSGPWYVTYEKGTEGNVPTLRFTDQKGAYTFMDRATYLVLKDQIKIVILVENDEVLLNYMSLIPVNPQKFPRVNHEDTLTFVKWLTFPEKGQKIVRDFGKEKYGSPLFFPNSKEWRESQGQKN